MQFTRAVLVLLAVTLLAGGLLTGAVFAADPSGPDFPSSLAPGIFFTANPTSADTSVRRIDLAGDNESTVFGPVPMFELVFHPGDGKFYGPSADNAIRRMTSDGSAVETLLDGLDGPNSLQLDTVNGKLYWFDLGRLRAFGREVRRANLDGSNMETIIPTSAGLGEMSSLTIDPVSGKLYVVDSDENIRRANLDGTGLEIVFTPTQGVNPEMSCIAVDATNGKFYWFHDGGSSGNFIGRANLDGSDPESLIPLATFPSISCPVLDVAAGTLFWADSKTNPGTIQRANLDGSDVTPLLTAQRRPNHLQLGPNDTLYWWDQDNAVAPVFMRAGRDGSNPETVVDDLTQPQALAVTGIISSLTWIDQGALYTELRRSGLDGEGSATLIQAPRDLRGIAADRAGGHLYLSNGSTIVRIAEDGSQLETVVAITSTVDVIDLDLVNGKVYWATNPGSRNGKIARANLDGSEVEDVYVVPNDVLHSILGLALDVAGNRVYWSYSASGQGSIWSAELDGANPAPLIAGLNFPRGLGLDLGGGKLYWVDSGTDKVQRADLDGDNVQDLVTNGLSQPYGLAVDAANNAVYWADTVTGIGRAALDGSGATTLYDGPASPYYLAVIADAPDGGSQHMVFLPMTTR